MSSDLRTIRWGIIGCGDVTEKKSGPAFRLADRSKLVAVMRRDAALAEDYARRHLVSKFYSDIDRIINDPQVDALYIATPPSTHAFFALKVAEAGKPAYVEKPMAMSSSECESVIEAFEARNLPLFVAYYRRALPRFKKIKSILESNDIGNILLITIKHFTKLTSSESLGWRVVPAESGGGLFHDVGCHTLDIIDFILGPIVNARGSGSNQGGAYDADDVVVTSFEIELGDSLVTVGKRRVIPGTGTWCFCASYDEECIEIVGSHGNIRFTVISDQPVIVTRSHAPGSQSIDGNSQSSQEVIDIPHPNPIQGPLIQEVVDELIARGYGSLIDDPETPVSAQETQGDASPSLSVVPVESVQLTTSTSTSSRSTSAAIEVDETVICSSTGRSAIRTARVMDSILSCSFKM